MSTMYADVLRVVDNKISFVDERLKERMFGYSIDSNELVIKVGGNYHLIGNYDDADIRALIAGKASDLAEHVNDDVAHITQDDRDRWDAGGGGIPDAPTDGKLYGRLDAEWAEVVIPDVAALIAGKQDALTPGDNITIENNVISAIDTIYDDTYIRTLINGHGTRISTIENDYATKFFVSSSIAGEAETRASEDERIEALIPDVSDFVTHLEVSGAISEVVEGIGALPVSVFLTRWLNQHTQVPKVAFPVGASFQWGKTLAYDRHGTIGVVLSEVDAADVIVQTMTIAPLGMDEPTLLGVIDTNAQLPLSMAALSEIFPHANPHVDDYLWVRSDETYGGATVKWFIVGIYESPDVLAWGNPLVIAGGGTGDFQTPSDISMAGRVLTGGSVAGTFGPPLSVDTSVSQSSVNLITSGAVHNVFDGVLALIAGNGERIAVIENDYTRIEALIAGKQDAINLTANRIVLSNADGTLGTMAAPSADQVLRATSATAYEWRTLTASDVGAATAAQGTVADSAVQSASFAGTAFTKSGTALSITQANARTALGLGTAAYQASTAFAPATHTHGAGDIDSGVFAVGRIPDLDMSKIITGNLAWSRITGAPSIPVANDGVLTIQRNGVSLSPTFSANQSTASTINITVPTTASDVGAISNSIASARLVGRYSAGVGGAQEISLGTGLSLNASGVLSASGGTGTVTQVSQGSGMSFTAITGSGTVSMATPSSVTASSTNSAGSAGGGHSHTAGLLDMPQGLPIYGSTSTTAGTPAKAVTLSGASGTWATSMRRAGTIISVAFPAAGSTSTTMSLTISSVASGSVSVNGSTSGLPTLPANFVGIFMYDGTNWRLLNPPTAASTIGNARTTWAIEAATNAARRFVFYEDSYASTSKIRAVYERANGGPFEMQLGTAATISGLCFLRASGSDTINIRSDGGIALDPGIGYMTSFSRDASFSGGVGVSGLLNATTFRVSSSTTTISSIQLLTGATPSTNTAVAYPSGFTRDNTIVLSAMGGRTSQGAVTWRTQYVTGVSLGTQISVFTDDVATTQYKLLLARID